MLNKFKQYTKTSIFALIGLLIACCFTGSAHAAENKAMHKENKTVKLSSQADSYVDLGELEVTWLGDGARFSMSRKMEPEGIPFDAFEISFDFENNSYKTERIIEQKNLDSIISA